MLLSFDDLHKLFGLAVVFLAAVLGRDEAQVEGIIVLGEVGCPLPFDASEASPTL